MIKTRKTKQTTMKTQPSDTAYCYAPDTLDQQPQEDAITLTYNGLSHLVMMTTPHDMEDFAVGFSLSEGLIQSLGSIRDITIEKVKEGWILNLDISSEDFHKIKTKRRYLQGNTGCGLCGQDSLTSAIPDLTPLHKQPLPAASIFLDIRNRVSQEQQQRNSSGGLHGAFLLDANGNIIMSRADIGRHNAMDKLLGGAVRKRLPLKDYCVVLTSRCSIELIQKAVRTGIGVLATFSAPSRLAIITARKYNLNLIQLPRDASPCIYSDGTAND